MVYNKLPYIACHVNSDSYKAYDKATLSLPNGIHFGLDYYHIAAQRPLVDLCVL